MIAIVLDAMAYKNILKKQEKTPIKGIVISLLAGIAMGFFYKYVAQSMSSDFVTPEAGKLTPYTALVVFSVGILASNFIFNTLNMYKPITGTPVTYKDYFTIGKFETTSYWNSGWSHLGYRDVFQYNCF